MHPDILHQLARHATSERIAQADRERLARTAGRPASSGIRRLAPMLALRPSRLDGATRLVLHQPTTPPHGD